MTTDNVAWEKGAISIKQLWIKRKVILLDELPIWITLQSVLFSPLIFDFVCFRHATWKTFECPSSSVAPSVGKDLERKIARRERTRAHGVHSAYIGQDMSTRLLRNRGYDKPLMQAGPTTPKPTYSSTPLDRWRRWFVNLSRWGCQAFVEWTFQQWMYYRVYKGSHRMCECFIATWKKSIHDRIQCNVIW